MKILFLNPEGMLGGAERCLIDLVASFRASRPDIVTGLVAGGDGPLLDEVRKLGADVRLLELPPSLASLGDSAARSRRSSAAHVAKTLGSSAAALATYVAQMRSEIARFSPDIVQSNGMKMHLVGALARPRSARLVWYVHDFIGDRRLASRALRALSRRAHLAVTNSETVRQDFMRTVPRLPARLVLNAIDTGDFSPTGDRAKLDELAGESPRRDVVRVGLIATFARWKGQDVFLEAAKLARERSATAPLHFYIVGSAIYRTDAQFTEDELRTTARALGVAADVSFVPFQKNPADVFRALDIVVHASSRPEPFGRTIVEAMACGRAVIGVADGGAAEIIRDEENALAVAARNPSALADAIVRLANDAGLRSRLGEAGRADAIARFSRARLAADMLKAYQAIGD